MKTVSIIIGHEPGRPGARNKSSGITEYAFNEPLAELLRDLLMINTSIQPTIIYRSTGDYAGLPDKVNMVGSDCAISLHANGHDGHTDGCETLYYYKDDRQKRFAGIVQRHMAKAMRNNDRGLKPITGRDRGGHLLKNVSMPAVIAEPFFIDNDAALEYAQKHVDHLANAYCRAIGEFLDA